MSKSFAANSNKIQIGSSNLLAQHNSASSLVVWAIPTVDTQSSGQIRFFDRSTTLYLALRATRAIDFTVWGGTNLVRYSANNTVTFGVWQCVAYTWDGSTTAANVNLYHNGNEVSYVATTNGVTPTSTANAPVWIGNREDGLRPITGHLAHWQMFNRKLNIAEVRQAMRHPGSVKWGLQAYHPLTGTTATEPDYSGNGNHGTVSGVGLANGATNAPVLEFSGATSYFMMAGGM